MDKSNLREVDRLEVTILIDNYTDIFMAQSKEVNKKLNFNT